MSIKADRWIKKMALEHGMIEPFVEDQVRNGVVSYGLSSYGYDIRIADEFKIFTNVNSAIIDPKNFDPRSLVDLKADVCIIPPNSFVLGRTVEYFRIPRNVLSVCLGKSTYARCFRGDTKVALADGTAPTLEDMARRHENGEMFWGYSIGENGRMIVSLLDAPRHIGTDSLIDVTLDNGQSIACTPDHHFMRRDGRMVEAHELRPSDSLMPLYRQLFRGYEMAYQLINGHWYPTHRLADEWNTRNRIYPDQPQTHRHHIDHDRLNNRPWNIKRMDAPSLPTLSGAMASTERHSHQNAHTIRLRSDVAHFKAAHPINHKVASIKELAGTHDVFCLTVPEAGNFALDAGVFVANCGLIVNVTPFEPGWEGYVTLEVSNTTPLPAKIYANEGIAQVLFFEGDEEPMVAYNDRTGKYQGQTGVTLPRI
ncbi:MAG: dCTP deaminase [Herpetosiphonaceae bacterium]|nr:dCTP deaminase [Herpetosiphonaceae bacterium]